MRISRICVAALFTAVFLLSSPVQADSGIEFEELLKLFIPKKPEGYDGKAYLLWGWDMGSDEASPIRWKHKGIIDRSNKNALRDFSDNIIDQAFVRTGEVVITVKGKPTHFVLETKKQPVKWGLTLAGPRGGVMAVGLAGRVFSQEFGGFGDRIFLVEDKSCAQGNPNGWGSNVYSVELGGRVKAWLGEYHKGGGSGGFSFDYLLIYNEKDRKLLGCR